MRAYSDIAGIVSLKPTARGHSTPASIAFFPKPYIESLFHSCNYSFFFWNQNTSSPSVYIAPKLMVYLNQTITVFLISKAIVCKTPATIPTLMVFIFHYCINTSVEKCSFSNSKSASLLDNCKYSFCEPYIESSFEFCKQYISEAQRSLIPSVRVPPLPHTPASVGTLIPIVNVYSTPASIVFLITLQ